MSVNNQNFYQMKIPINAMGRQSTGIDNVLNLDTDYVSVAQQKSGIRVAASGAIASFETNIVAPLLKCIASIEPVQEGTGDPSPENVRPITGWTSCNIVRTGKNFLPLPNVELGKPGNRTVSIPISIPLKPGEYKLAFTKSGTPDLLFGANFFKAGTPTEQVGNTNINTGMVTITKSPTSLYIYIRQDDYDANKTLVLTDMQLVLPDETGEYEAYTGHTYTINFPTPPGTVYGGTLTINEDGTGTLVIDYVKQVITSVTSAGVASTGVRYGSLRADVNTPVEELDTYKNISSRYKYITYAPSSSGWFRVRANILFIFDDRFTSLSVANEILASEKPEFVYKILTPITYNMTNLEVIRTLNGTNNIWADTGNISIEYLEVADI